VKEDYSGALTATVEPKPGKKKLKKIKREEREKTKGILSIHCLIVFFLCFNPHFFHPHFFPLLYYKCLSCFMLLFE
jgi:hypothetical protein